LIAGKAIGFLLVAIVAGQFMVPHVLKGAGRLETRGVLLTIALSICLLLAWAAYLVGLAPIVGAFAAGLVLDEVHYQPRHERRERELGELLQPVSTVLVPIFFVLMGMKTDLRFFMRADIIGFAAALTLVAIFGKQICSLGIVERGVNRLAIGLGMIPRGEVGLIFAGIGASLSLPNAAGVEERVISSATFSAVVIMVLVTTLVTPPALKWALTRNVRQRSTSPARK
jgi:Kef-type K+ transport system membrane component KefB